MKQILEYALIGNFVLAGLYVTIYWLFLYRLKHFYPSLWERLVNPTMLKTNTIVSTWSAIVFIFTGDCSKFAFVDKITIYSLRVLFITISLTLSVFTLFLIIG
jgi:hypothetical protein